MITVPKQRKHRIRFNEQVLEQVSSDNYLGIIVENSEKRDKEISGKNRKTGRMYKFLKNTFFVKERYTKGN